MCGFASLKMPVLFRNGCASSLSVYFTGITASDIGVCSVEFIAGVAISLGESTDHHGDG